MPDQETPDTKRASGGGSEIVSAEDARKRFPGAVEAWEEISGKEMGPRDELGLSADGDFRATDDAGGTHGRERDEWVCSERGTARSGTEVLASPCRARALDFEE